MLADIFAAPVPYGLHITPKSKDTNMTRTLKTLKTKTSTKRAINKTGKKMTRTKSRKTSSTKA